MLLELLQFCFKDVVSFIGTAIIIGMVLGGISEIIKSIKG